MELKWEYPINELNNAEARRISSLVVFSTNDYIARQPLDQQDIHAGKYIIEEVIKLLKEKL